MFNNTHLHNPFNELIMGKKIDGYYGKLTEVLVSKDYTKKTNNSPFIEMVSCCGQYTVSTQTKDKKKGTPNIADPI